MRQEHECRNRSEGLHLSRPPNLIQGILHHIPSRLHNASEKKGRSSRVFVSHVKFWGAGESKSFLSLGPLSGPSRSSAPPPKQQLTHFTYGQVWTFACSPDGKQLAFAYCNNSSDVVRFSDFC